MTMLADVPMVFILIGITAYTVLSGADFGAACGRWRPAAAGRTRPPPAITPGTRSGRSGRPTTSG
jgi:hypothetical protein